MAVTVVQKLTKTRATAVSALQSVSGSWTSNLTAGNSLIVFAWAYKNNTYTWGNCTNDTDTVTLTSDASLVFNVTGSDRIAVSIWHQHALTGGNKPLITVNTSAAATIEFGAVEVSGLQNVVKDASNTNSNASTTTTPTTGAVTTTVQNSLIAVAYVGYDPATFTFTEPTNFTSQVQETDNSTWQGGDGATNTYTAVQAALNPQWTTTTSRYAACVAAYKGTVQVFPDTRLRPILAQHHEDRTPCSRWEQRARKRHFDMMRRAG